MSPPLRQPSRAGLATPGQRSPPRAIEPSAAGGGLGTKQSFQRRNGGFKLFYARLCGDQLLGGFVG